MRDQIHRMLKTEGKALSYPELASKLLKADGLSESVSRAILEPLLENNPNFSQDPDGSWRAAQPYLEARFLPEVTFAVVDIETTGGRPPQHRITDLAAVVVRGGERKEEYNALVNPGREIPWNVVRLTGITDEMVADRPGLMEALPGFLDFIEGTVFVAHCANFDHHFISYFADEFLGREFAPPVLCTFKLAQRLLPQLERYNLGELASYLGLPDWETERHRALGDARATAEILITLLRMLQLNGLETLQDVLDFQEVPRKEAPALAEGLSIEPAALNDLPAARGVFRLLDGEGRSVYAGKAPDIQRTVRDLFYPKNRSAARFTHRLRSVRRVEAFPMESELGMSLRAGRMMRETRLGNGGWTGNGVGFLKVSLASKFPRVYAASRLGADGAAYYGPFRKQAHLRDLIEVIHAVFPLRRASRAKEEGGGEETGPPGGRPAPAVPGALYRHLIEGLQALLEGRSDRREDADLLALLERAWDGKGPSPGRLRRLLGRLRHLIQSQSLSGPSVEKRNLIIVEPGETRRRRVCYFLRRGLLAGEMEFDRADPPVEALAERIRAVYFEGDPLPTPDKEGIEEAAIIAGWMRRELMDGFLVEVSEGTEAEDVLEILLRSLGDPQAAGSVISL